MRRRADIARVVATLALLVTLAWPAAASADKTRVTLWHAYRGAEQEALEQTAKSFNGSQDDIELVVLAQPFDSFASKLTTAIPRGNGPDLFIFAHDRLGDWVRTGTVAAVDGTSTERWLPQTVNALEIDESLYGYPLAFKSTVLFYNKKLVAKPPATTDELAAQCEAVSGEGRFCLATLYDNFYYHAAWHFGFGGELWADAGAGDFAIDSDASLAALQFSRSFRERGWVPEEPTGALVTELFNSGRAAFVIQGASFIGEIDESVEYGVAPFPVISEVGRPARPFLSVEAVYVSGFAAHPKEAAVVAGFLADDLSSITRAIVGRQAVANQVVWRDPAATADYDPALAVFRAQLDNTELMSSEPRSRLIWEPWQLTLRKLFRQDMSPKDAAAAGMRRYRSIDRPAPSPRDPLIYLIILAALGIFGLYRLVRSIKRAATGASAALTKRGWLWISPAVVSATVLLFIPFAISLVLALFAHRQGDWTFVGLSNFSDILFSDHYGIAEPLSFYFALVVTVLWTLINLALHVGIGLGLALLLSRKKLFFRPIYRVLFIIPWAVPNYITALIWKGMFNKQQGVINGLIEAMGGEGISWFSSFGTAFFANICANAWLGFPFMMVVCLGALQSIPQDLYEAADVDGASAWQKFRHVTLPLLRPALIPAMLIGTVWTFNQFNIVYLVSGGEPDNATDILISEAYRWAFTRQEQYGYAAAYAALIFGLLLLWSIAAVRIGKRAEAGA